MLEITAEENDIVRIKKKLILDYLGLKYTDPNKVERNKLNSAPKNYVLPISPETDEESGPDEVDADDEEAQGSGQTLMEEVKLLKQRGLCGLSGITEIFYPERGEDTKVAKKFCQECALRGLCGEVSLITNERFGIWGGLSERSRRKVKKELSIGPNAVVIGSLEADNPIRQQLRSISERVADLSFGIDSVGRPSEEKKSSTALIDQYLGEVKVTLQQAFEAQGLEFVVKNKENAK